MKLKSKIILSSFIAIAIVGLVAVGITGCSSQTSDSVSSHSNAPVVTFKLENNQTILPNFNDTNYNSEYSD